MTKKIFALITALVLTVSALLLPVNAVTLPEGLEREQIRQAIPKLDDLLEAVQSEEGPDVDIRGKLYEMLLSDSTLNAVFQALYAAFSENEDTFRLIGVDISVQHVADCLVNYPEVSSFLRTKQSFAEVFSSPLNCRWGLREKGDFSVALSDMLRPFQSILYVLLCAGKAGGFISVQGANGYENAIVPLLQAAGCPAVMSQSEFTAQADKDAATMVKNAADMFLAAIDNLLDRPLEKMCRYLPGIADYLSNGGIEGSARALITPLVINIGIIPLSGLDRLIDRSGIFSQPEQLGDMFEGFDISAFTVGADNIKLPDIELARLAECTKKTDSGYETDEEAAYTVILGFLFDVLRENAGDLGALTGGEIPQEITSVLSSVTEKSNDELIKAVTGLLTMTAQDAVQSYRWTYPAFTPSQGTYPAGMTRENFQKVFEEIDETLDAVMTELAHSDKLSVTVRNTVYSPAVLTALVKGIYGTLDDEKLQAVLPMLGIDASPEGVAQLLAGSYPAAADTLRHAKSWEDIEQLDLDIKTGKRKGFEKALNTVLSPLAGALDVLLCEGSIELLGVMQLYGSDGYNTAVIPLLEALGCPQGTITGYESYKRLSPEKKAAALTKPVFELLDTVIEAPVKGLCRLLPNIIWFCDCGGLKTAVENLLYPVTFLLEKTGLTDILPEQMRNLGDIDLTQLITQLTASVELGFQLPEPDLKTLMTLGTAQTRQSVCTYQGAPGSYTYIEADEPAVLVAALRYILDALNASGTDLFGGLMGGQQGSEQDAGMMSMYTDSLSSQLEGKTTDELIAWLYDLFFKETPKREQEPDDTFIPTIVYQAKQDHTKSYLIFAAVAAVILVAGVVLFIAKYDFSERKERRQRKRNRKQETAQMKAVAKAQKKAVKAPRKANREIPIEKNRFTAKGEKEASKGC